MRKDKGTQGFATWTEEAKETKGIKEEARDEIAINNIIKSFKRNKINA